jgi:hypothetical protein
MLTELPQPARLFMWCFIAAFLSAFILAAATRAYWVVRVGMAGAGSSIFLFGLCIFRDVNGAASTATRIYKESRGIAPEGFTLADVPTIKGMGFFYILIGVLWVVAALIG